MLSGKITLVRNNLGLTDRQTDRQNNIVQDIRCTAVIRLAVLVYRCLHDSAPGYLASDLQRVSDLGARRRLRSSSTSALVASRTVRATIGDRAFPSAAASVWNSLPETVRASPSLPVFRRRLKTELFVRSHERLTVLTTMWPHIIVTCPCSPRTLCHVKSIRYHHHHRRQSESVGLSVRIFKMLLLRQLLSEWDDILTQCSPVWSV